jgi:hypothetical protein
VYVFVAVGVTCVDPLVAPPGTVKSPLVQLDALVELHVSPTDASPWRYTVVEARRTTVGAAAIVTDPAVHPELFPLLSCVNT